jgi:hypothetical protein
LSSTSARSPIAVIALFSFMLSACSGQPGPGSGTTVPNAAFDGPATRSAFATEFSGKRRPAVTSADFQWIKVKGTQKAVATCPNTWTLIAGGSTTADGIGVGTGSKTTAGDGWQVAGYAGQVVFAQASCVSPNAKSLFTGFLPPGHLPNGATSVRVACPSNFPVLVQGYADGALYQAASYPASGADGWIAGVKGPGAVSVYDSCASASAGITIRHVWGTPPKVFVGCPSGVAIAGNMGNFTAASEWPGPPTEQYVANSDGTPGNFGWWVFSNQASIVDWVTCVST